MVPQWSLKILNIGGGENLEELTQEQLENKQKWLFKENIRLEELSRQLQNQKSLFDKQWQILERETRQLAADTKLL